MLTRLDLRGVADVATRLHRHGAESDEAVAAVRAIRDAVREKGDVPGREPTARFDGVELDELRVAPEACAAALARVPADLRAALEYAAARIEAYHRTQVHAPTVFERDGIRVESRAVPVDRAGCYVPGGRA